MLGCSGPSRPGASLTSPSHVDRAFERLAANGFIATVLVVMTIISLHACQVLSALFEPATRGQAPDYLGLFTFDFMACVYGGTGYAVAFLLASAWHPRSIDADA